MCEATQNQKKVVLVTGASRGIGKAVAERFAREGYAVALHYNTGKVEAEATVQKLTSAGYTAMAVQADVRDSAQVQQMVDTVSHALGNIGILINNAGIAQQKLFTDITDEEWHNMFAVHVDGTFYCTRAVLPVMIRQKQGCIVNISSMWGQVGASCEAAYSATKGAVIALTKALAKELGPSGIRVNCVTPGVILTDMCAGIDPEILKEMAEEAPVGRNGTPMDVAKAMEYLSEATFVTGQVLPVNGGYGI